MKGKIALVTGVGVAMALISACGGGSDNSGGMLASMSLDTAQVLTLAKVSSETNLPTEIDGGKVTLNDASETSDPVEINAT